MPEGSAVRERMRTLTALGFAPPSFPWVPFILPPGIRRPLRLLLRHTLGTWYFGTRAGAVNGA